MRRRGHWTPACPQFGEAFCCRECRGHTRSLFVLGGVDGDGATTVNGVSPLALAYRHQFGRSLEIDDDVCRTTKQLANALTFIHSAGSDFRRLRAGSRAVMAAIEDKHATERLHQYVRALDGLMKLPKGPGKDFFVQRGPTFVTAADLQNLLGELYVLRNTQEHLNDFQTVIVSNSESEFDQTLSLRAYQAEHAALSWSPTTAE